MGSRINESIYHNYAKFASAIIIMALLINIFTVTCMYCHSIAKVRLQSVKFSADLAQF